MGEAKLEAILNPKSIAVIGVSRQPGSVGHETLRNIIESGFPGKVYPVNPRADKLLGLKCYHEVKEIEGPVDLGVVAVPAGVVPEVAEEAGENGFKGFWWCSRPASRNPGAKALNGRRLSSRFAVSTG
ncbi:TPA: hypothetical protein EYP26_06130 [Candidatus Bathyarchaeota archaeon]|nr:hypothetical protein [Candidatus Bathyarchaeota archaeon]